jgi:hypothetical protein
MDFEAIFLCIFPLFFIIMWGFVLSILANVGGWSRLAQHYQAQTSFEGKKWHFRSGRMGLVNYKSCLTIGSNNYGLYVAALPLFRIGHPPLLIPWSDITTSKSKNFWISYMDFTFAYAPAITFKLPEQLGFLVTAQRE